MLFIHGDAPTTHLTSCGKANLDWSERNIDGIPGLMVMGEYEWWEDRLQPALAFRERYPDAPLSILADAARDHSEELIHYMSTFRQKALEWRLDVDGG